MSEGAFDAISEVFAGLPVDRWGVRARRSYDGRTVQIDDVSEDAAMRWLWDQARDAQRQTPGGWSDLLRIEVVYRA